MRGRRGPVMLYLGKRLVPNKSRRTDQQFILNQHFHIPGLKIAYNVSVQCTINVKLPTTECSMTFYWIYQCSESLNTQNLMWYIFTQQFDFWCLCNLLPFSEEPAEKRPKVEATQNGSGDQSQMTGAVDPYYGHWGSYAVSRCQELNIGSLGVFNIEFEQTPRFEFMVIGGNMQ